MSTKLKEDIRRITHRKLESLTGSAAGMDPCDDPYAISSAKSSQPECTQFPDVDALRPDLTPDAKKFVRERIQQQLLHLVFYLPYGTELAGKGFFATDSLDYNNVYEETLENASDVVIQTAREGNVEDAKLAYELTYGLSVKEKGRKVEWNSKARFTKNSKFWGTMRKMVYPNKSAVIKRAEYET